MTKDELKQRELREKYCGRRVGRMLDMKSYLVG
jgi:hypothetical protein